MSKGKSLTKLSSSKVKIFKIANRRGYAAVCNLNLTEGKSAAEAFARLVHPLRRQGYELTGSAPSPRKTL